MKKKIIVFLCIIFSTSGCSYQNNNGNAINKTSQTTPPIKEVVKYDENKLKMDSNGLGYIYDSEELEINDENKDVLKMICESVIDKDLTIERYKDFEYETYFIMENNEYTGGCIVNFKGVSVYGWEWVFPPYQGVGGYQSAGGAYGENILPFREAVDGMECITGDGHSVGITKYVKEGDKLILISIDKYDINKPSQTTTITTPVKEVVKYDENKLKMNSNGLSYIYDSEELEINDENKDVLKMICEAVVDKSLTIASDGHFEYYGENFEYDYEKENFEYETYFFMENNEYTGVFLVNFKGVSVSGWYFVFPPYEGDVGYWNGGGSHYENILPFREAIDGMECTIGDGHTMEKRKYVKEGDKLIRIE